MDNLNTLEYGTYWFHAQVSDGTPFVFLGHYNPGQMTVTLYDEHDGVVHVDHSVSGDILFVGNWIVHRVEKIVPPAPTPRLES